VPRRKSPPPAADSSVADTLARLQRWLSKHRRRYFAGLRSGADAAALDQSLPPDLRALLAWHDGQSGDFVGHFEQDWDLMSAAEIGDAKKELDADPPTGWKPSFIPFLADDMGDYLCVDSSQPEAPVFALWRGKKPESAAPSLAAWLRDFVAAVERGDFTEDPERGTFLRRSE
jgi:cell wall assembly regulator SMI1